MATRSDVRSSQVCQDGEEKEFEEVTETRIIGVTESGVIRKRSFKRKMTREERTKLLGYGHCPDEYERIRARLVGGKMVTDSIETLKERLKMINFMHEDCMDLVAKWEETRQRRMERGRHLDRELLALVIVVCLLVLWFIVRWCFRL